LSGGFGSRGVSNRGTSGSGNAMSATTSGADSGLPAMIAGSSGGKPRGAGFSITVHSAVARSRPNRSARWARWLLA
jgi:hypothetical protein